MFVKNMVTLCNFKTKHLQCLLTIFLNVNFMLYFFQISRVKKNEMKINGV